jgi:hypothetical protein
MTDLTKSLERLRDSFTALVLTKAAEDAPNPVPTLVGAFAALLRAQGHDKAMVAQQLLDAAADELIITIGADQTIARLQTKALLIANPAGSESIN